MLTTRVEAGREEECPAHGNLDVLDYVDPDAVIWRVKRGVEPALRCRTDVYGALDDLFKIIEEEEGAPESAV